MPSVKAYQARKHEIELLKMRIRILETYIRHAYGDDIADDLAVVEDIPSCLKPFDAIKYAGGSPMAFPQTDGCALPPPARYCTRVWYCTQVPEHDGPCAVPIYKEAN